MRRLTSCHRRNGDHGQVLPIMALFVLIIIGLAGLAADVGKILIVRAELGRSVDAAALAGAKALPDIANADAQARAFIAANDPDSTIEVQVYPDVPEQQVRVVAHKTVNTIFMRVFGIKTFAVRNDAIAGFGTVPVDAYLTLDATGSMHTGCNASETNTGGDCPIKEARDAATGFVNTLLASTSSGATLVGAGAFRGCYNPPRNNIKCIPGSMITGLSNDKTALAAGIGNIHAIGATGQPSGGSGTNICQALKKAQDVLFGPGHHVESNTRRYAVILTDGDHVYNATEVNQTSPMSPESPCRPTNPSVNDGDLSPNCRNDTQTQEAKLDALSYAMANTLKGQGVEIYVVGLSICGGIIDTSALCDASIIGLAGAAHPDRQADHNLLKCVASSSPGTNDHFYETTSAADLPGIFSQIARSIAFRLIK